MGALQHLAGQGGNNWWKDVLARTDLVLAVRDRYLCAYSKGQRIFEVQFENPAGGDCARPRVDTHYKYLIRPKLDDRTEYVQFDGDTFAIDPTDVVQTQYEPKKTVAQMIAAASRYEGMEKKGVHKIADENPNVVDLEIAFSRSAEEDKGSNALRMDFAVLTAGTGGARLVFCEAKRADNPELSGQGSGGARHIPVVK
jgi:hypothetical protein